jgi:hypothetical protein
MSGLDFSEAKDETAPRWVQRAATPHTCGVRRASFMRARKRVSTFAACSAPSLARAEQARRTRAV